jgi:Cu(I)/Ag(I) efflux system membrane fusion protein
MKAIHKILPALLTGAMTIVLTPGEAHAHSKEFTPELVTTLVQPYLAIQQGLAGNKLDEAKAGATAFVKSMANAPQTGDAKEDSDALIAPAKAIAAASDMAAARRAFQTLTEELSTLLRHKGTTRTEPLYRVHCPMAFDNKGADWVQADKTVANPYFGAAMLRCGSIKAEISPTGTHTEKTEGGHEAHH